MSDTFDAIVYDHETGAITRQQVLDTFRRSYVRDSPEWARKIVWRNPCGHGANEGAVGWLVSMVTKDFSVAAFPRRNGGNDVTRFLGDEAQEWDKRFKAHLSRPPQPDGLHAAACAAAGWADGHDQDPLAREISALYDSYEDSNFQNSGYALAACEAMWPENYEAEMAARLEAEIA